MKEEIKKKISESLKEYHRSGLKKVSKVRKIAKGVWRKEG
jgi:hypothetical protein